jgi:hypothetical protein
LLFKLQQSLRMPLNASSVECESKEFTFTGFNDVAFDRVNDQFQAVIQESADTTQHPFTRTRALYQYGEVIRVSGKLMASFLKLFVQRVEHDVGQQSMTLKSQGTCIPEPHWLFTDRL